MSTAPSLSVPSPAEATTGLVERARAGDRDAFSRLVELHWRRLVACARSVVGDGTAEDAVQDALVRAWRALPGLRDAAAFPSWITRVTMRQCLRRERRTRWRPVPLEDAPEPRVPAAEGQGIDVERLLGALAPRQRAVMHLTVVEGLSDREIGELLEIAPASVRSHRRRARQALERLLDPSAPSALSPRSNRSNRSNRSKEDTP